MHTSSTVPVPSYEETYTRYYSLVYRFIFSRIARKYDAEDITQEVFFKVYRYYDRLTYGDHVQTWVFNMANQGLIDYHRNRYNSRMTSLEAMEFEAPTGRDEIGEVEERIDIERTLHQLAPDDRQILELVAYQGYKPINAWPLYPHLTKDGVRGKWRRARYKFIAIHTRKAAS